MYSKLFHIYGPLYINSYGLAIAIGFVCFSYLLYKDRIVKKIATPEQLNSILTWGILSAFIGGRILFALSSWQHVEHVWDLLKPWYGGFSILGSIIGVLITIPALLKKYSIPITLFMSRVAIYGPLLQSISRLGCFFAGCCFGKQTLVPWAIIYTNTDCIAPLNTPLHPTQIYSAILLFTIFLFMYFVIQYNAKKPMQIILSYLLCVSSERFVIDFFRADRIFKPSMPWFSFHQWIALIIFISTGILLVRSIRYTKKHESI